MKVAVIGAGAAGLCAIRHAVEKGFICECFEQTDKIGGTWNYSDLVGKDENGLPVHSSMYKGLRTNIPKEVMEYADFPYPKQKISYISQEQVLEYMSNYASHFGLVKYIKFNSNVKKVHPVEVDGIVHWEITVVDVKTREEKTKNYDAVMVCNGHYSDPFIPNLKGSDKFKGRQWHSHDYREPSCFAGKNVLVVGAGPSGVDIAAQVVSIASKVYLSHGNELKTPPAEGIIQKTYVTELTDHTAIFQDESEENIDEILYCTGYKYTFPFLNPECGLEVIGNRVHPLYKQVINIVHPTMSIIGIPFRLCPFPMFDIQVTFVLAALTRHFVLPSKDKMLEELLKEVEEKRKNCIPDKHFHFIGLDQENYFNDLADTARIKRIPAVVNKIYCSVSKNRNLSDCFEIINENEYRKL